MSLHTNKQYCDTDAGALIARRTLFERESERASERERSGEVRRVYDTLLGPKKTIFRMLVVHLELLASLVSDMLN